MKKKTRNLRLHDDEITSLLVAIETNNDVTSEDEFVANDENLDMATIKLINSRKENKKQSKINDINFTLNSMNTKELEKIQYFIMGM